MTTRDAELARGAFEAWEKGTFPTTRSVTCTPT